MGLVERLAQIREMQGKEPLSDPTKIYGPPAGPEAFSDVPEEGEPNDGDFYVKKVEPPSPLVPRATAQTARDLYEKPGQTTDSSYLPKPAFIGAPAFQLIVCDKEAAYQGYAVTLSQSEYASMVEIVINATKRVLQDRLAEVQTKRWEEMRASQAGPETATTGDPDAGQSVPRKRGRPRKKPE